MKKALFLALLLSSTLAFGQQYPASLGSVIGLDSTALGTYNLCIETDQTLTTTGTSEEVLATCTIPGGTLGGDFSGFEVMATWEGAANANSKTAIIKVGGIGGTSVLDISGDTDSGDTYEMMGSMLVVNAASGNLSGSGTTTQGTGASTTDRMRVTGLTLSADIDIVWTGTTSVQAGDITLTSFRMALISAYGSEPAAFWPLLAPDGTAGAPSYSFGSDPDYGLYRTGAGIYLGANAGSDYFRAWTNQLQVKSTNGTDFAEFSAQGNYVASGDPIAIMKVWDAGNTAQTDFWCTSRDSEEGCHLGVDDGTDTSDITFGPTDTTFTDPILLPYGTTAAPALAMTSNTDMGLFGNASLELVLQTADDAGVPRSSITLHGDSGITNPKVIILAEDPSTYTSKGEFNAWNQTFTVTMDDTVNDSTTVFKDNETTFSDPVILPAGTQDLRALQSPNEARAGIHFPGADQATFGAKAASGSYQGEFRASASGSVASATVYAADGGNAASFTQNSDAAVFSGDNEVRFGAGSAGNPIISFTGNLNDGIFWDSGESAIGITDDQLVIATFAEVSASEGYLQLDEDIALKFEGATDDTIELILTVDNPTVSDGTLYIPDLAGTAAYLWFAEASLPPNAANSVWGGSNRLAFEGSTPDSNEISLSAVDPSANRTIWLPDEAGYLPTDQQGTSTLTDATGSATVRLPIAQGEFAFGQIHYNVTCTDGTNIVALRIEHEFVCSNDAGTESCTHSNNDATFANIDFAEESIGTASIVDYDALFNSSVADTVDLAVDIDCSLTPTVFEAEWQIEFARGYWRTVTEQN